MAWRWPLMFLQPLPSEGSPNAFSAVRKHHVHEGVDILMREPQPVYAVEPGIVRRIDWFTGPQAGSPWWLPTKAIMVEGESGLVVYGEVAPRIEIGTRVNVVAGTCLGMTARVLRNDKGAPTTMLHMELREPGHTDDFDWALDAPKPSWLLDPTKLLHDALRDAAEAPFRHLQEARWRG